MDRRGDLAMAIVVAMYGALMIIFTAQLSPGPTFDPIGKQGLPFAIGAFMLACGLFLIARRLRVWRAEPNHIVYEEGTEDEPGHPASAARAFGVVGLTMVYAVSLPYVGFLLATPVYIVSGLWLMQFRSVLTLAIVSIGFTLTVFIVFSNVLSVPLPVGPLLGPLVDLGWIDAVR